VLSLLAGHAGDPRATSAVAMPHVVGAADGRRTGSLHDAYAATVPVVAPTTGTGEGVLGHQPAHLGEQGVAMVLAHLVAAVLLGLFLARGEAALRGLVGVVGTAVGAVLLAGRLVPATPVLSRRPALTLVEPAHRSGRIARDSTRRRGPPFLLAA